MVNCANRALTALSADGPCGILVLSLRLGAADSAIVSTNLTRSRSDRGHLRHNAAAAPPARHHRGGRREHAAESRASQVLDAGAEPLHRLSASRRVRTA